MAPTEPPVIPRQVLYRLNLRCPLTYRTGQSQAFPSRYLRDVNDGLGGVFIIQSSGNGDDIENYHVSSFSTYSGLEQMVCLIVT